MWYDFLGNDMVTNWIIALAAIAAFTFAYVSWRGDNKKAEGLQSVIERLADIHQSQLDLQAQDMLLRHYTTMLTTAQNLDPVLRRLGLDKEANAFLDAVIGAEGKLTEQSLVQMKAIAANAMKALARARPPELRPVPAKKKR